jgi:hypothetical protein
MRKKAAIGPGHRGGAKYLLRHRHLALYYARNGGWTADPREAENCADPLELIEQWHRGADSVDAEVVKCSDELLRGPESSGPNTSRQRQIAE